jgi:ATP-binding cassette, subfamily B, bacterial
MIFQDFVRYNFTAGENIGVGRVAELSNRLRIVKAASQSLADQLINTLPMKYEQTIGRMFDGV